MIAYSEDSLQPENTAVILYTAAAVNPYTAAAGKKATCCNLKYTKKGSLTMRMSRCESDDRVATWNHCHWSISRHCQTQKAWSIMYKKWGRGVPWNGCSKQLHALNSVYQGDTERKVNVHVKLGLLAWTQRNKICADHSYFTQYVLHPFHAPLWVISSMQAPQLWRAVQSNMLH